MIFGIKPFRKNAIRENRLEYWVFSHLENRLFGKNAIRENRLEYWVFSNLENRLSGKKVIWEFYFGKKNGYPKNNILFI